MPPLDPGTAEVTNQFKKYYRSANRVEDTPEFRDLLKREFPDVDPDKLSPVSRRRFLQLLGASAALASATGCRWEDQKIAVENQRGEGRAPGVPQLFASAMEIAGVATPVRMTCYDGRPVKTEGNPLHPESGGATTTHAQAATLGMYDPDRSKTVVRRGGSESIPTDWDAFQQAMGGVLRDLQAAQGEGLAILTESSSSVTMGDLRKRLTTRSPKAKWFEFEPISRDQEREGMRIAFGAPHRPQYRLERADVVLCIDDDILGNHPSSMRNARDFATRRNPEAGGTMNRLYAIEGGYSLTGAAADHRFPMRSSMMSNFLARLDAELGLGAVGGNVKIDWPGYDEFVKAVGADLKAAGSKALITVGPDQPAEIHAHVARLNASLGSAGNTVEYAPELGQDRSTHLAAIQELTAAMNAGSVKTLVILGGNPVYNAPADLDFAGAMKNVEHTVHLSVYDDETSRRCEWHLPAAHWLESWGDSRSWDGSISIVQPTIAPLYNGRTAIEVLAMVCRDDIQDGYDLVRRAFDDVVSADDRVWNRSLHDGVVRGSATPTSAPAITGTLPPMPPAGYGSKDVKNGQLEIQFVADAKVLDGRFSNNGWLQELPDFLTKLTWDNAALIGPSTAEELGITSGDLIELEVGSERSLTIAAYVMPGHAPGAVSVALGYGRTAAGVIGGSEDDEVDPVGFDTYSLRGTDNFHGGLGLMVKATGETYPLAATQDHFMIDTVGAEGKEERIHDLIREGDLTEYREDPEFVQHMGHGIKPISLWEEFTYDEGHRWGMGIDLTQCTGCNACVIACQAENNIPIVGKEQVLRGREMHWLRIDRYFSGDPDDASVVSQPLPCQQCERAPCEEVCPVGATMHSSEGLNDMVYNRCVGTRYCSNNCPYKVRRFNFFNYHEDLKDSANEVMKMVFNPEVSVRARGVMEKCTYCVQRIADVRIRAKNEARPIRDGEITPACAQTCPSAAISFGDLNDKAAKVTTDHANLRAYSMLAELNIRPRTAYLARIKNQNPALAKHEPKSAHSAH